MYVCLGTDKFLSLRTKPPFCFFERLGYVLQCRVYRGLIKEVEVVRDLFAPVLARIPNHMTHGIAFAPTANISFPLLNER